LNGDFFSVAAIELAEAADWMWNQRLHNVAASAAPIRATHEVNHAPISFVVV
jgi:hypothetical protein